MNAETIEFAIIKALMNARIDNVQLDWIDNELHITEISLQLENGDVAYLTGNKSNINLGFDYPLLK